MELVIASGSIPSGFQQTLADVLPELTSLLQHAGNNPRQALMSGMDRVYEPTSPRHSFKRVEACHSPVKRCCGRFI